MKKTCLSLVLAIVGPLSLVPRLPGQAVYTATRQTRAQVGIGIAAVSPDYSGGTLKGFSFWGDFDFKKYIGIEGTIHLGTIITPDDIAESTYLVGPRALYHRGRLTAYAKILVGRGTITNQDYNLSSSYNALAFGGGIEYRVRGRFNVRALDVELQKWPNFQPHPLSPVAYTFGVAYIIK